MAVGKGSLLRAANAAGKERKTEKKSDAVLKEQQEAVLAEQREAEEEQTEAKKLKDVSKDQIKQSGTGMKAAADKTEKKAKTKAAKAKTKAAEAKTEAAEIETEAAETKTEAAETKTEAEEIKTKAAETKTEAAEIKTEAAEAKKKASAKTGGRKSAKKQAGSAVHIGTVSAYLLTVPVGTLREIPSKWRSPKYVRPNVSMLAESVSRCGILEPLPVVQVGENLYQLVGGSRRMQVVQMLGIEDVPVIVLPGNSEEDAWKLYAELHTMQDRKLVQPGQNAAKESGNLQAAQANTQNAVNTQNAAGERTALQENGKSGTGSLFGKQRIPAYLL